MTTSKLRYGMTTYTKSGFHALSEYRDSFYEVLQLYVQAARMKDHPQPTLWVYDGEQYVRVHDFNFSELSPTTYAKYLSERIIYADDLLENITD